MNLRKYFHFIVLLILLEIISTSSANDWKKLKRKLFALTLLHGIRVKTIIPLPVPLPLPYVIHKHRIPVVLPPKKVPFLVPKPVPYFQIIPKFVPIYSKDTDSYDKQWTGEESLLPSSQMTHEDYLLPSDNQRINEDFYKQISNNNAQQELDEHTFDHNIHKFHHDEFVDPFEQNSKHKFPKNRGKKVRKQKFKPFNDFKEFNFNDENGDNYEDLLMVSSRLKTEPQDKTADQIPYLEGNTLSNNRNVNNQRLTTGYEVNKQLKSDSKPNIDKNKGNGSHHNQFIDSDSPGAKTTTRKIKLGELRLQHNQLKALLAHHKNFE